MSKFDGGIGRSRHLVHREVSGAQPERAGLDGRDDFGQGIDLGGRDSGSAARPAGWPSRASSTTAPAMFKRRGQGRRAGQVRR